MLHNIISGTRLARSLYFFFFFCVFVISEDEEGDPNRWRVYLSPCAPVACDNQGDASRQRGAEEVLTRRGVDPTTVQLNQTDPCQNPQRGNGHHNLSLSLSLLARVIVSSLVLPEVVQQTERGEKEGEHRVTPPPNPSNSEIIKDKPTCASLIIRWEGGGPFLRIEREIPRDYYFKLKRKRKREKKK